MILYVRAVAVLLVLGAMTDSAWSQPAAVDRSGETCPVSDDELLVGDPIGDMEPLVREYQSRGREHFNQGQYQQALAAYDCAVKLTERFLSRIRGVGTIFERYAADRAWLYNDVGHVYLELQRHDEASEAFLIAYFFARSLVEQTADSPLLGDWTKLLIAAQTNAASALCTKGETKRCIRDYEDALAVAHSLSEKQKEDLDLLGLQVMLHRLISEAYSASGNEENAQTHDLESLLIMDGHLKRFPEDNVARSEYLHAHARIGRRGGASACEHLKVVSEWMKETENDVQAREFRNELAKIVDPAMEKQNCN